MASTNSAVEWEEARKAEGATLTASLIPRPPNFTGRVACTQAELLRVVNYENTKIRLTLFFLYGYTFPIVFYKCAIFHDGVLEFLLLKLAQKLCVGTYLRPSFGRNALMLSILILTALMVNSEEGGKEPSGGGGLYTCEKSRSPPPPSPPPPHTHIHTLECLYGTYVSAFEVELFWR